MEKKNKKPQRYVCNNTTNILWVSLRGWQIETGANTPFKYQQYFYMMNIPIKC